MPSHKPRTRDARPGLRQRLAALKTSASRAIRRPAVPDAELLAMEAAFWSADAERIAAFDRQDDADNARADTPMPAALRVQQLDWIYSGIPRPRMTSLGDGTARVHPYGAEEVEFLRANPCTTGRLVGGTVGERQPDVPGQARADAIVAAWDRWQADRKAARDAVGLPALEAAQGEAMKRYEAILIDLRRSPATSLGGLAAKARVATDLIGFRSAESLREAAEHRDPDDFEGMLFSLVADLLDMAGSAPRG